MALDKIEQQAPVSSGENTNNSETVKVGVLEGREVSKGYPKKEKSAIAAATTASHVLGLMGASLTICSTILFQGALSSLERRDLPLAGFQTIFAFGCGSAACGFILASFKALDFLDNSVPSEEQKAGKQIPVEKMA